MNNTPKSNRPNQHHKAEISKTNPRRPWHICTIEEVAKALDVSMNPSNGQYKGLLTNQVIERQFACGPNSLGEQPRRTMLSAILAQFTNIIVVLLVAASSVAFLLGDIIEGIAVMFVIVINAAIGFMMEWKAERALEALKKQVVPTAIVVRDGKEQQIPASELVPGDLVLLNAGDRVAADGRVIEAARLYTIEAALTGESLPVAKVSTPLSDPEAPVGDQVNMVFKGTAVADGRARFIVTAIGDSTELGKIGTLLGGIVEENTPLERKLRHLGNALVIAVIGLCGVITVAGWYRGNDFLQMLEVAISLAIAAVPEGLPAVATMALALGMQRMARMQTVIRRLPAVETLGSTTVVCTDKTGTLTKNEMTVCALQLGKRRIEVTGSGYVTSGSFIENGHAYVPQQDPHLLLALRLGALCNDAGLDEKLAQDTFGDPTEIALLVVAHKAGLDPSCLALEYPRIREVPFSSESKRMATYHRAPDNTELVAVKGAVGVLLAASSHAITEEGAVQITDSHRADIRESNNELAGKALRVLALAYKNQNTDGDDGEIDHDLTFVGLVGMSDPLRDEAHAAVAKCRDAGIRVVMITGDQIATASEIGAQLGIMEGPRGEPLRIVHGKDLAAELEGSSTQALSDVAVFARVSPEHKLRIVEGFQAGGHIVAMTGDGVNDAPALKKADIGIAMGIKGSEVAKDASDMVITDDNFATIVYAIEQGRIIYSNIIRFIHYLFSCNLSEIFVIFFAIMLGLPLPLAAIQLLWLNMITDIFPALALVLEPSSPGMMQRPPRRPEEPIISKSLAGLIAIHALILCIATLTAFKVGLHLDSLNGPQIGLGVTMAFTTLSFSQVIHALSSRSQHRSVFVQSLGSNYWLVAAVILSIVLQLAAVYFPPLQRVLHTVALGPSELLVVVLCSTAPLVVVELLKRIPFSAALSNQRGTQGVTVA
jgi:Ca2+-transporting ATPase